MKEKRVLVGLSGGVDSAVAAWLLKEAGYRVEGVFLHNGFPLSPAEDAARVAAALEIPLHRLDVSRPFEEKIVRYFVEEYRSGRTPNPCIRCNRAIKIPALREEADRRGIPWIATGHYARTERLGTGETVLLKGRDRKKDQSYFLFEVRGEDLARLLLPLGDRTKEEVRALGRDRRLPSSGRESQEICFIPDDDHVSFLNSRCAGSPFSPGPVRDRDGNLLGSHRGIHTVTVGQRRGLGIASTRPWYVVRIDGGRNTITVGREEDQYSRGLVVRDLTFHGGFPGESGKEGIEVKIRYRHPGVPCTIERIGEDDPPSSALVRFQRPQKAVAPGQGAAFYAGDRLLGGGWIERGMDEE
jgi:tRNA-specific 2-thiouridylase